MAGFHCDIPVGGKARPSRSGVGEAEVVLANKMDHRRSSRSGHYRMQVAWRPDILLGSLAGACVSRSMELSTSSGFVVRK